MCGLDRTCIFGAGAQGDNKLFLGPLTNGFEEAVMRGDCCPNDRTSFGNRLTCSQVKNQ